MGVQLVNRVPLQAALDRKAGTEKDGDGELCSSSWGRYEQGEEKVNQNESRETLIT